MRRAPSRASSSKLIVSSLRTASSVITLNMSRRSFLAGGGAPASFQHGQGGRYAAFSCQGLIHRFRRYLFTSVLEDIDATPLLQGLPDDRCQCPHWGYVLKGKMTARYADRDEVFEAGDAFYTPPGHVPVQNEPGTEILWFSPSEELRTAEAVMLKNVQAMQDGSTP